MSQPLKCLVCDGPANGVGSAVARAKGANGCVDHIKIVNKMAEIKDTRQFNRAYHAERKKYGERNSK